MRLVCMRKQGEGNEEVSYRQVTLNNVNLIQEPKIYG